MNPQSQSVDSSSIPPAVHPPEDKRSKVEQVGHMFADWLIRHFEQEKAQFLWDDAGQTHAVLHGRQIRLVADDLKFAALMLGVCKVSTTSAEARVAIQRLNVYAQDHALQSRSHSFSAVVSDENTARKRVYVPIAGDKLLEICEDDEFINVVPNATNLSHLWITHPKSEPFKYIKGDPQLGLADFERLLVDTQACMHPPMRWFVGMHGGLFPFVRDLCSSRFIVVNEGPTQNGKTSGAQRHTLLHGLGKVDGDATVAGLSNEADPGLQVLDNKEQANFNQSLIDYCLFLSTGAERKRSNNDGTLRRSRKTQPAAIITSIEGVFKPEMRARCVEVTYRVSGMKVDREKAEEEIVARRHIISSSLMHVLKRFLSVREQHIPTPNPFNGNFGTHFTALCDLLRAFGQVAGKPARWAEPIIREWDRIIRSQVGEGAGENELEFPIQCALEPSWPNANVETKEYTHGERKGTLRLTTAGFLLSELRKQPGLTLPKSPEGLTKRLKTETFQAFTFLSGDDLRTTNGKRRIGFFFPKEECVTEVSA